MQNGESVGSVTLSSSGAINTAATGTYNIIPSVATGGTFTASNYIITYVNGTLTVNPAILTYTANAASRTYGAANPSFSGAVSGFVNSETIISATTGTLSFSSSATATSAVGSYATNGSGLTANNGNYIFARQRVIQQRLPSVRHH